jgi:DeoR/GlpR family transcriptional regulator of sugar metabolism
MLTRQRKQYILERLGREGQVVAKALSDELGMSEDTIRRDLRELAAEGHLQRVHGGALPASPAVVDLRQRQALSSDEKVELGRFAAAKVLPGQVVFLDGGTTTLQMARALPETLQATVVTHSPIIAAALVAHPRLEIVQIGGRVFKHSGVAVGSAALAAIRELRADTCFLGVTGLHPTHGLSTGDLEEAHIKRALIAASAETVVLLTLDKLGVASPYTIAPVRDVTTLLMTRQPPAALLKALRQAGMDVEIAGARVKGPRGR